MRIAFRVELEKPLYADIEEIRKYILEAMAQYDEDAKVIHLGEPAKITKERLMGAIHYSPTTGMMTWKHAGRRMRVGEPAGSINHYGRRIVMIDNVRYWAAKLAWLYMTGEFPETVTVEEPTDEDWANYAWDRVRNADGETLRAVVESLGV
jgi:hypothetical protein